MSDTKIKTGSKPKVLSEGIITYVKLPHLCSHPEVKNRDLNKEHVQSLVDSISANGLDTPLLVWSGSDKPGAQMKIKSEKDPVPGCFVVAGFHRRAAIRRISKDTPEVFAKRFPNGIPVKYVAGGIVEALAAQLRENVDRLDPEVGEIVPFVVALHETHKLKGKEIARKIGKSEAWVSQMLAIHKNLGKEGVEAVAKEGASVRDAVKGAKDVKSGKVSKDEAVTKIKNKTATKKAGGKPAQDLKRVSAKTLYARYTALPSMKTGARLTVLESALAYLAGQNDEIPTELEGDSDQKDNKKSKKPKAESDDE